MTRERAAAEQRRGRRRRRLIRVALWSAVSVLAVTSLGSIALTVLAVVAPGTGQHWASATGPIGDTFGGVLGPILNTAVLATTVWVAVVWQPKHEKQRRKQEQEQDRAAAVVGWIAETEDKSYFGVVVTNDADSLVRDVDIAIGVNHSVLTPTPDREVYVPRGTWFIPFATEANGRLSFGWKLPVPVREADGMEVSLLNTSTPNGTVEKFYLRPHLPEQIHGVALAHFTLDSFRYKLHGQVWSRTQTGSPEQQAELSATEETEYARYAAAVRESARAATSSKRVVPSVEQLLRFTLEAVTVPLADGADVFDAAFERELAVNQAVLPGVRTIRRPSTGGTLHLMLAQPDGVVLRFAQSKHIYPNAMDLIDPGEAGLKFVINGRNAIGIIKRAGAQAIGRKNAGDIECDAQEWIASESSKAQWLVVLRAIVARATDVTALKGEAADDAAEEELVTSHDR